MASISFYGGVGRIGSTKLVVEQDGYRVLMDLGLLPPGPGNMLPPAVRLEAGRELAARLAVGEAPRLPRLYRPEGLAGPGLAGGSLEGEGDGRTALFVSHCHIDHMGLVGWVSPAVPIYTAPETAHMISALEAAGQPLEGGSPTLTALPEGERAQVGPMSVERVAVDHDVPGASGYLVSTDDGVVAYSGDLRLHGRHPERSLAFAERARGSAALVVEGTTLGLDPATTLVAEVAVDKAYDRVLSTPGLVLQTVYPRDIERVLAFGEIAASHGREVLWPEGLAKFLTAYGVPGVRVLDDDALGEASHAPDRYAVQVLVKDLGRLLALPIGPGSVFVHANGEPLGPFQPTWQLLHTWLGRWHVPFVPIGTSGHLTPADLDDLLWLVRPETVYPVHTADPYRLAPPAGARRVLPENGRSYRVADGSIVR